MSDETSPQAVAPTSHDSTSAVSDGLFQSATAASEGGATVTWEQQVAADTAHRLVEVFGFLGSDSQRCCMAIAFGLHAFDQNGLPRLCNADSLRYLPADAQDKYRTLNQLSYMGGGGRERWTQTAPKSMVEEMAERLPHIASRQRRTRAFAKFGLTSVEIGIGMGETISEKAFQKLSDGGEKSGGGG